MKPEELVAHLWHLPNLRNPRSEIPGKADQGVDNLHVSLHQTLSDLGS